MNIIPGKPPIPIELKSCFRFFPDGTIINLRQQTRSGSRNTHYMRPVHYHEHTKFKLLFCILRDDNGIRHTVYKHIVVSWLNHLLPAAGGYYVVSFKNGDKRDCRPENIEWLSQGEVNRRQEAEGRRDMKTAAKIMRARRPSKERNYNEK